VVLSIFIDYHYDNIWFRLHNITVKDGNWIYIGKFCRATELRSETFQRTSRVTMDWYNNRREHMLHNISRTHVVLAEKVNRNKSAYWWELIFKSWTSMFKCTANWSSDHGKSLKNNSRILMKYQHVTSEPSQKDT